MKKLLFLAALAIAARAIWRERLLRPGAYNVPPSPRPEPRR